MRPSRGFAFLFILLVGLWSGTGWAWVWDDGVRYGCSDSLHPDDGDAPTHVWSSIAATGTAVSLGDDELSSAIPIGFSFDFYGADYTDLYISSNGFVSFDSGSYFVGQSSIPTTSGVESFIAFAAEDLDAGEGGNIYYETLGAAPDRTFVVEFSEIQHYPSGTPITAQVVLFETSNEIMIHYLVDSDDTGTHLIGIENAAGDAGVEIYSTRMDAIDLDGQSIRCANISAVDADGDGYGVFDDCDDDDAAINPDATEVCGNEVDEDCDGYANDFDCDGYDAVDDGGTDCDDGDATINPDGVEVCDGVDNDCDDELDERDALYIDGFYACYDSIATEFPEAPTPPVWASISATGTAVTLADDEVSAAIPIGFEFPFYGVDYSELYISSNGFLTFNSGSSSGCCIGQDIPVDDSVNNMIAFAWTDLCPECGGAVYYETFGTAPERTFVVEFNGVSECCSGIWSLTAQVVLDEATGELFIHYLSDSDLTYTTSIGLENADGSVGLLYNRGSMADIDLDGETIRCIPYEEGRGVLYRDADEDGWGDPDVTLEACGTPEGWVTNDDDCDDFDTGTPVEYFGDFDHDGYGDPARIYPSCGEDPPPFYIGDNTDCDDAEATTNPGSGEVCDGVDNNCSGVVDEIPWTASDSFYGCVDSNDTVHPEAPAYGFSTIAASGTELTLGDDDVSEALTIGFDFDFYGGTYSELYVSSNGFIAFTEPSSSGCCSGQAIPSAGSPNNLIAFMWEDLDPPESIAPGVVYYATTGVSPDRSFIVEFVDVSHCCSGGEPITVQVELREASNEVLIHYETSSDDGGTHTIGLENGDGSEAVLYYRGGMDEVDLDGVTVRCLPLASLPEFSLTTPFYADVDRDGYGDPDSVMNACERPALYVDDDTDCDDTDRDVYPGAEELCDGIDNDCNDTIDDGAPTTTFYLDADGDGFGDESEAVSACAAPAGYVDIAGDCDDGEDTVYPLATEICDELDNNCNDEIDEGVTTTYYADADEDGYGSAEDTIEACELPEGYLEDASDCDDTEETVYPGADELCDGLDNDCDGTIDDGEDLTTFWWDEDGDGFGDTEYSIEACIAPDGFVDNDTDCDDANDEVFPDGVERCDGLDNDCDGEIDEGATETYYEDADGDGFGDEGSTTEACFAPAGFVANDDDCDDDAANVNPDAVELADEIDNDCDGEIDEDLDDGDDDEDGCGCTAAGSTGVGGVRGALRLVLSLIG